MDSKSGAPIGRRADSGGQLTLLAQANASSRSTDDRLLPAVGEKDVGKRVRRPIICILTSAKKNSDSFRGNRANFRDICRAGDRLGLTVVVSTPAGLQSRRKMDCFLYTGDRLAPWRRATLPLPDVVYNRVPDREAERRSEVIKVKKWLAKREIPLFNERFYNKAEIHRWLESERETSRYLPASELLQKEAQISQMLKKQHLVYLKPVDGKAGEGIVQIRTEGKGYRVTMQKKGARTSARASSRHEAAELSYRALGGRPSLIQQGVRLASYGRRPFDLRLLLQKDGRGMWDVTGIGARIADADGITTHVPNGGQIENADQVLSTAFGKARAGRIEQSVRRMALAIAATIEQKSAGAGHTGEMSMDIGVASDGSLYFFEANAKPMKFDEPTIRAKSLRRLLAYCKYLAAHPVS